jgi:hypothetical protein
MKPEKIKFNRFWLSIIANTFLFFSALLLLIDFAPRDLFPNYISRRNSIEALRKAKNIMGPLPTGIVVKGESSDFTMISDPEHFKILSDFIRERAPLESIVNWDNAIGVGYATISLPVGPSKLDAFHPLYIVEMPSFGSTVFKLSPVGLLTDLDKWLSSWRQSSLTNTALVFLFTGFLIQLFEAILKLVPDRNKKELFEENAAISMIKSIPDTVAAENSIHRKQ